MSCLLLFEISRPKFYASSYEQPARFTCPPIAGKFKQDDLCVVSSCTVLLKTRNVSRHVLSLASDRKIKECSSKSGNFSVKPKDHTLSTIFCPSGVRNDYYANWSLPHSLKTTKSSLNVPLSLAPSHRPVYITPRILVLLLSSTYTAFACRPNRSEWPLMSVSAAVH